MKEDRRDAALRRHQARSLRWRVGRNDQVAASACSLHLGNCIVASLQQGLPGFRADAESAGHEECGFAAQPVVNGADERR